MTKHEKLTGQRNVSSKYHFGNAIGAAMIEAAMVLGVIFFLALVIADFSRFTAVQAVLTKGAQQGLNLAQKLEGLEIDVGRLNPKSVPNDDQLYKNFVAARNNVIAAATALPLASFVSQRSGASAELFNYTMTDAIQSAPSIPTTSSLSALLLRPGESASFVDSDSRTWWVDHPTKCSKSSPTCAPLASSYHLSASYDWPQTLAEEPFMVEVRATVRMMTPLFPKVILTGRAVGYRERTPKGSYPEKINPPVANPSPTPVVTPTYTPTPTPPTTTTTTLPTTTTTATTTTTTTTTTVTTTTVTTTTLMPVTTTTTTTTSTSGTTTTTTTTTSTTGTTTTTTTRTTTTIVTTTTTTRTTTTSTSTTTTMGSCSNQQIADCWNKGGEIGPWPACTCNTSG